MPLSIRCVALFQVLGLLLLLVVHDVVLLSGSFGVADSLTRNLDGGLIVKKKSVQMVPDGGTASVGSGELLCSKNSDVKTGPCQQGVICCCPSWVALLC